MREALSENGRKVINVSASYAYLSSLTKDYPLLPDELAASQENVQRYVAALAADPISALTARAGTEDCAYTELIRDLISVDSELTELLANTLTSRFRVVKSFSAPDELFSLCSTLPRVFRENNAPGCALMHYLCELTANILTADNISPALAKRLDRLHVTAPTEALTVKGKIVFSRLFVATVEFIMAHQPHVLYMLSGDKTSLYRASREQELRNFIRDAVDEIPEDTGNMGLFASDAGYQDEESEAIAKRVDNLIRRAASIAQSANLISGDGSGEIVEADLPGRDETFDAGSLSEDEIRKFFRENPHTGMSGLYDEELLSRYDFSKSRADLLAERAVRPEAAAADVQTGASVKENASAFARQSDIDLIGEFNSFKAQCEKLSGGARDAKQAEVPQNVNLSRRVNELIQKVANDVEYINSGNAVADTPEKPETSADSAETTGNVTPDAVAYMNSEELRIFSDENSLSEAIAREKLEEQAEENADEVVSESGENADHDAKAFVAELETEQEILMRQAESVRNDTVPEYPDPNAGNGGADDAGEEYDLSGETADGSGEQAYADESTETAAEPSAESADESYAAYAGEENEDNAEYGLHAEEKPQEFSENADAGIELPETEAFVDENEVIGADSAEFTGSDEVITLNQDEVIASSVSDIVTMPLHYEADASGEHYYTESVDESSSDGESMEEPEGAAAAEPDEEYAGVSSADSSSESDIPDQTGDENIHVRKSLFSRFRDMFRSSGRKNGERRPKEDFNDINHRSVPMNHLMQSLNEIIDDGTVSPEIANIARSMRSALTEPLKDQNDVMEWLGFVGNPLTTGGRRGRIIQQWTILVLAIRFKLLGKDVSSYGATEPYNGIDIKGNCRWVEDNLFLTLQQIERMQLLSGFTDELGLPAFMPLPPLYAHGREGGINVSHTDGVNGRCWKINFFFELEELGAVQILTELDGNDVRINLVSEKFETLRLINDTCSDLRDGIEKRGLSVAAMNSRMGTVYPPSV